MEKISLINNGSSYSLRVDDISIGSAWVGKTDIVPEKEFMGKKSKVVMGFGINFEDRKKGLGQVLMDKIVESEKSKGTDYLRLGVEVNNEAAIKIYERAGFIKDGSLYNTMHYMWKKL